MKTILESHTKEGEVEKTMAEQTIADEINNNNVTTEEFSSNNLLAKESTGGEELTKQSPRQSERNVENSRVAAHVRTFSASRISPLKDTSRRNSVKDEIRQARAKRNSMPSEASMNGGTSPESEYKLQFQNLEQKREIRFLTKTIEEMQGQIASYKKRVKQLNDTMDIKLKNGEEVIDKEGKKFVFLAIENERALKADLTKYENEWKKSCREIEQLKSVTQSLREELSNVKKNLHHEKESGNEKSKLAGNLRKQIETLEKLLSETEAEMRKQNEKSNSAISAISADLDEANQTNEKLSKEKYETEEKLEKKCEENQSLLATKFDLEKIIEGKSDQINKLSNELDELKKKYESMNENIKKETKEKEEFKQWLVELKVREEKMIEEKDKMIRDKQKEIKLKSEQEKRMKERIKKLEKDVERLTPKARWR